MMRDWTYTASSRDVLGCTSPPTSRFPPGHLSGLGTSLGRRGCTTQYIPPLGSVRIQSSLAVRSLMVCSTVFNTSLHWKSLPDLGEKSLSSWFWWRRRSPRAEVQGFSTNWESSTYKRKTVEVAGGTSFKHQLRCKTSIPKILPV